MSNFDRWRSFAELNCCFYDFADPYELDKYREARDIGTIESIKTLMILDIFGSLECGELHAYGFRTHPDVSDGPVLIPAHCFAQRPEMSEVGDDVIVASGWRYERVRVGVATAEGTHPTITITSGGQLDKKVGRPSTYPAARVALTKLSDRDPTVIRLSANRLLDAFNAEYLQHAASYGLPSVALSERTLRNHLKQFRQELAEIGNDKSSN